MQTLCKSPYIFIMFLENLLIFNVAEKQVGNQSSNGRHPVGRGGGGHFHICGYWLCALCGTRETPFSDLNFRSRAYNLLQMSSKSAPEPHHFTVFAAPETIIFKMYLPSFPSPPTAGLLRQAQTQSVCAAPRGYSRLECQPYASYKSAPETL